MRRCPPEGVGPTRVSRLQSALHDGSLKVAKRLAETKILVEELEDFQVSFSETGAALSALGSDAMMTWC